MGAIFLSYAREDRPAAERIAQFLEKAGHSVWWDRRLGGGEEFSAEIEAELDKAEIVLVTWSSHSIKSRWVRDEAAVGGDSDRLVPVSIDGSLPPMGFRQFHTMDLSGWKGGKRDERSAALLDAVDRRLKTGHPKPEIEAEPAAARPRRKWNPALIAAPFVLIAAVASGWFLLQRRSEPGEGIQKPTIAIVPFTTASADAGLASIASQARDSIAHTFSQSGVPIRLAGSAAEASKSADFVIGGDISRAGDKVVANVRLDEAAHSITVYTHQFEAASEDAPNLAERIGAQMAGNLTWAAPMAKLDRRHPTDPALLADLLQGSDFTGDDLQAYQTAKRVAEKAPNLFIAQLDAAFGTAFALAEIPREDRDQAVSEARHHAERALALNPTFGDSYGAWCALHSETRRAECEDRLRAGKRIDPDAPFLNTFLSHLMRDVGRFQESVDLARLAYTHDAYLPTKISWMLKTLEYSGDSPEARDLYARAARWWPELKGSFFRNRIYGLAEAGDIAGMLRVEKELGPANLPPNFPSSATLVAALKSKSVIAAKQACPPSVEAYLLNLRCMIALAALGDQDGAYAIVDKLYPARVGRTPAETERIWLDDPDYNSTEFVTSPAAAPLRSDPRFLALAERTGLMAYWRTGRRPDFCRGHPEPVCQKLFPRG